MLVQKLVAVWHVDTFQRSVYPARPRRQSGGLSQPELGSGLRLLLLSAEGSAHDEGGPSDCRS